MHIMTFKHIAAAVIILLLAACKNTNDAANSTPTTATDNTSQLNSLTFSLEDAFPDLDFSQPVGMYQSSSMQWFLIEQSGIIKTFKQNGENPQQFLDIEDRVRAGGERGLLGMALSPDFDNNGYFYVSYTSTTGDSVISLFSSRDLVADASSEKIVLTVEQPYSNHNGGQISFGPDGFLYIGLGDGGSGGDPRQHGQNTNTLLGALLRIDVSNNDGSYSIPDDNPFSNTTSRPEIFAYGLRNPWRWSFDKKNGELWLADVGQNAWEEINIVVNGGNYGWNILEGNSCYLNDDCDKSAYESPIYVYSHDEGYAVTGGYVYRGSSIPALEGHYVYGDYVSKKIWALKRDDNNSVINTLLLNTDLNISAFAEDNQGNLFVIGHQQGKVFKLKAQ